MYTVEHFDESIDISLETAIDEDSIVLEMVIADLRRRLSAQLRDAEADNDQEILTVRLIATERYGGGGLNRIKEIIEAVDCRCLAADGPFITTSQEVTEAEISEIYKLAGGEKSS